MSRCALLLLALCVVPACTFSEKVVNNYNYYGDTGGEQDTAAGVDSGGSDVDSGGADGQEPVLPLPVLWEGSLTVIESGTPMDYRLVLATQPAAAGALDGLISTIESGVVDIVQYGATWPLTLVIDGVLEEDGAAAGRTVNTATSGAFTEAWAGGLTTSGPDGTTMTGEGTYALEVFTVPTSQLFSFTVTTAAR
jgi:hypothetical protein